MMRNAVTLALLSSVLFAAGAETGNAGVQPVIPQRIKPAEKELLMKLKEAGDNGMRVEDETAPEFVTLLKAVWVEINDSTRQGKTIVARLSPSGKAKVEAFRGPRDPSAPNTRPPVDFVPTIEDFDLSKLPVSNRVVRPVYPFDQLTAKGKSMFYPAPDDFPEDKDFASTKLGTVNGYNRKQKEAFDKLPPAERPAEGPAVLKAINDTVNGKKGVRFVRVS